MNLRVYAGGSQTSKLYEDDGKTQEYHNGRYRLSTFTTQSSSKYLKVNVSMKGDYSGAVKTFTWQVHELAQQPRYVKVDGKKVNVQYDQQNHTVTFKTYAKSMNVEIRK